MMYCINLPIFIKSTANLREHWSKKHKREVGQRFIVRSKLIQFDPKSTPFSVKLIRNSPRLLDTDNLAIAFKHIRDEIASYFLVKDDPSGPISWEYDQEKVKNKDLSNILIKIRWYNNIC